MTKMKFIFSSLLLLILSISSCELFDIDDGVEEEPKNDLKSLLSERVGYSLFNEALDKIGLEVENRTIFVPRNDAFETYLNGRSLDDIDPIELEYLMNYHILFGQMTQQELPTGYSQTDAFYRYDDDGTLNRMDMYINTANNLAINQKVKITLADIVVDDGVIHEVDKVIAPPTTLELAEIHGLDSFVAAVDLLGLRPLISESGPYSIYAPTNEAFQTVMAQKGWNSLSDIPTSTLESTIKYHIAENAIVLEDNPESFDAMNNRRIFIYGGSGRLIDENQNDCYIVDRNIQGVNGVLHTIDDILGIL